MTILIVFLFLLVLITIAGHLIWVVVAEILRWAFADRSDTSNHNAIFRTSDQLNDLATTERQIARFYSEGKLNDETYAQLLSQIRAERARLVTPTAGIPKQAPASEPIKTPQPVEAPPSVVAASLIASDDAIVIEPVPSFITHNEAQPRYEQPTPPPRLPRKPFSEVLNSFMEESNIRWGEIIGGLLIIGCSTALVISLWAQISQIPALKFLIFTTVTAVLFGIGLYTEHRWKLPTTSRGILTIATLLVPLNFLAIAAVSASNTSGVLVIGSELVAPAIFLCLVYFAGRIITPGCAHILSAGVLGSSVGQLLVRHFAAIDASPVLLILLGAFPVACYVVTVGFALRLVLDDREIDETETTTVFTVLGTMSFAALLPFGLLLYKSGPLGLSMMYLAPLVTLWGLPMLATGTILWRRITNTELVASRTAGTALGILGVMVVLAGMILAWPNPASIVPAALLNFAIFTALAVALELPIAHLIAAICFALAYLVTCHVFAGNIAWRNLRVMSLLDVSLSVSSGQVLVGVFALFLVASEWLSRHRRERDSYYYIIAACLTAVVSLTLATSFGLWSSEYHALWIVYGLYSLGAFWIAWRRKLMPFTWIGSILLLCSLDHSFAYSLSFSFPWQTALLVHATLCAVAAIVSSRYKRGEVLSVPLNYSALISIVLGVVSLFEANTWEITWMQAQRLFWIAGILLLLLWLNRRRFVFNAFQIALTCAVVLTVKAALQQYEWYSYLPHAFLHPAALQIQGTVLALLCLAWLALRFLARRALPKQNDGPENWLAAAWRLLDTRYSVDRFVAWSLLGGFLLLATYGALSGVTRELTAGSVGFNDARFPHEEAFALGSWIVLGLLALTMLASFWERRRSIYLLGALVALSAAVPLLAGQFEDQTATATAWRWLAAVFFLGGSLLLWYRREISTRLTRFGWPDFRAESIDGDAEAFANRARTLLIVLTVLPLVLLTLVPTLRAIQPLPIQGPTSGVFSLFDNAFSYTIPLVLAMLVMIGHHWKTLRQRYIYFAGLLFTFAVSVWWIFIVERVDESEFLLVNLIAGSLAGIFWLWLELRSRKLRQHEPRPGPVFSFHNLAAIFSFGLLTLIVIVNSLVDRSQAPLLNAPVLSWLAFLSVLTFIAACLWDRHAKCAVAFLYSLGLIACAIALQQLELSSTRFAWSATILLAIYTPFVALLWRSRERLISFAQRFGVPQRISPEATELKWLSALTIITVAMISILAYWIDLRFLDFGLRASAALAVAAQFLTFSLLAEGAQERRWRRAAIAVLVLGAVLFGWSWLTPGVDATWLNRSVILMLEAFGLTALYGLLLNKANARFPDWTSSARVCVPWLLGAGVVALFFCLGTEISYQINFGTVRIHPVSLFAIGLTLVAAIVICVLFALSPSHDPLNLPERGRMRYVYAAEVMLALLFLHIRLTLPWLFTGFIERYWPLAVMVIAYLGVVTSEALRRRKLLVLAQPLERTGVFLPLLPVLGFWLASSEVDFSLLLFAIGGLYGLLSILRRSFVFGVLAAVAGNVGLWYVFHRTTDYQFLQHPQLWLIPISLSVLLAAYLNEDKLTEDQMAGVRYLSLVTLYASSTADIFINGVANSPWLPLILGSFSLAGVFAGIVFRIRGLLLLGSIFLLLSIITMIWYASVNLGWTWLWYVAGIVTGATIIFMFALFEKKRSEVLRVVEGLRDWER